MVTAALPKIVDRSQLDTSEADNMMVSCFLNVPQLRAEHL